MGDNIYLGDRNGVRTPMQWSSDRNGGFSRADPARLYAPPIMDPVYGYQAINVEAQERYPFSLLNWMKRLIAMRKQHRVFGRGSLEFVGCAEPQGARLPPPRRARNDPGRRQPVARPCSRRSSICSAFAGLIPIEMNGLDRVPAHRRAAVLPDARARTRRTGSRCSSEPMQVAPRVTAAAGSRTRRSSRRCRRCSSASTGRACSTAARARVLERQALAPFLQRQRWFASKSREIRQARFTDWAPLAQRHRPGVPRDRRRSSTPTADARATSCRWRSLSGEAADARAEARRRPRCSRGSPARARA